MLDTKGSAEEFCQAITQLILLRQLSYILLMTLCTLPPIPSLNSFSSKYSLGPRSNAFLKSTIQCHLHFWLLMYLLFNDFGIQNCSWNFSRQFSQNLYLSLKILIWLHPVAIIYPNSLLYTLIVMEN